MLERDTLFDNDTWIQCSPPNDLGDAPDGTGEAWSTIMKVGIRFARFVRMTRHARHFPEDVAARAEALALATELYALDLDTWIEELQDAGLLKTTRTCDTRLRAMVDDSFCFPSFRVLSILVQYWELRIMICGCIQTLLSLPDSPSPSPIYLQHVEISDLQSATNLIMSFDHLHKIARKCPAVELRSIFPMEMAFGAWFRLELREGLKAIRDGDLEAEGTAKYARGMQIQCLELQNCWKRDWNTGGRLDFRSMQWLTNAFSGGDIHPYWQSQHKTAG